MPKRFIVREMHDHRVEMKDGLHASWMLMERDEAMLLAIDLQVACTGLGKGEIAKHLADDK